MKAYKGFNRDMTCRGFQFEEGKTYTHQGDVKLCESGFHACEDPLDCLRYYDPCTSVYHEVEIDDVSDERQDDTKIVGKKIRIGARMTIKSIVMASIEFAFASCKNMENSDYASGDWSRQAATGDGSSQAASGYGSCQAASGYGSRQDATGDGSRQAASGDGSRQAASGDWSRQAATGDGSSQAASGKWSRQAASGDESRQAASGDESRQETTGKSCVMMSAGNGGRAKGKIGSWIVLTEWEQGVPNVVARRIDGKEVKEDVWYTLKDGKFAEVES
nr:MAG TPA: hypothetical protein [Caudoviricetes sp.]